MSRPNKLSCQAEGNESKKKSAVNFSVDRTALHSLQEMMSMCEGEGPMHWVLWTGLGSVSNGQ